ncbi:galactokinase [Pedobacter quisquiliarum]|uniref:Galactokinase n=1 Tax=Pedobacter quisquiliarum TaxID=1834438 RepID=A0A916XDY1_9SPHI|nr:galactokinase [Pedobacter quisquiliarum]GGC66899.1 galactokinase [Pedobacter quisquiliarum]
MREALVQQFTELYQKAPAATYFTPGRVNLIGEHIDYNGGLVLPAAVTLGTTLCMAPNDDQVFRFKSLNFPDTKEVAVSTSYQKEGNCWFNYPIGIINQLEAEGKTITGFDFLFHGNIPVSSGLSSSASIEVLTAYALNDFLNLGYSRLELALMGQKVENEFIGVNCGIMDQFAVAFGEKDQAILLNCDTLKHIMVDCQLGDYNLAIINTNKSRKLEESKYNERVAECNEALVALNQEIKLNNLCELTAEKFALHKHLITDPKILDRATHVVTENDRVHLAAKALGSQDLETFGRLMYASHESLKELYEVSGKELDTIVEFCQQYPKVIGARMTGAGFGGCAIALLEKGAEEDFEKQLNAYYEAQVGYPAGVYISEIGDGARKI